MLSAAQLVQEKLNELGLSHRDVQNGAKVIFDCPECGKRFQAWSFYDSFGHWKCNRVIKCGGAGNLLKGSFQRLKGPGQKKPKKSKNDSWKKLHAALSSLLSAKILQQESSRGRKYLQERLLGLPLDDLYNAGYLGSLTTLLKVERRNNLPGWRWYRTLRKAGYDLLAPLHAIDDPSKILAFQTRYSKPGSPPEISFRREDTSHGFAVPVTETIEPRKIWNSKGSTMPEGFPNAGCFFRLDHALEAADKTQTPTLIVAEGLADSMLLYALGYRNVVGIPGCQRAQKLARRLLELKWKGRVFLALDGDAAGWESIDSVLRSSAGRGIEFVNCTPKSGDLTDMFCATGNRARGAAAIARHFENKTLELEHEAAQKKRHNFFEHRKTPEYQRLISNKNPEASKRLAAKSTATFEPQGELQELGCAVQRILERGHIELLATACKPLLRLPAANQIKLLLTMLESQKLVTPGLMKRAFKAAAETPLPEKIKVGAWIRGFARRNKCFGLFRDFYEAVSDQLGQLRHNCAQKVQLIASPGKVLRSWIKNQYCDEYGPNLDTPLNRKLADMGRCGEFRIQKSIKAGQPNAGKVVGGHRQVCQRILCEFCQGFYLQKMTETILDAGVSAEHEARFKWPDKVAMAFVPTSDNTPESALKTLEECSKRLKGIPYRAVLSPRHKARQDGSGVLLITKTHDLTRLKRICSKAVIVTAKKALAEISSRLLRPAQLFTDHLIGREVEAIRTNPWFGKVQLCRFGNGGGKVFPWFSRRRLEKTLKLLEGGETDDRELNIEYFHTPTNYKFHEHDSSEPPKPIHVTAELARADYDIGQWQKLEFQKHLPPERAEALCKGVDFVLSSSEAQYYAGST